MPAIDREIHGHRENAVPFQNIPPLDQHTGPRGDPCGPAELEFLFVRHVQCFRGERSGNNPDVITKKSKTGNGGHVSEMIEQQQYPLSCGEGFPQEFFSINDQMIVGGDTVSNKPIDFEECCSDVTAKIPPDFPGDGTRGPDHRFHIPQHAFLTAMHENTSDEQSEQRVAWIPEKSQKEEITSHCAACHEIRRSGQIATDSGKSQPGGGRVSSPLRWWAWIMRFVNTDPFETHGLSDH
jgi:hypothetical protein